MKVVWQNNDLKMSQMEPFKETKFATYLSTIYRKKLTVRRVKVHDYLCIDLDYSDTRVVKVSMVKYIQKVLEMSPDKLKGRSVMTASYIMFW